MSAAVVTLFSHVQMLHLLVFSQSSCSISHNQRGHSKSVSIEKTGTFDFSVCMPEIAYNSFTGLIIGLVFRHRHRQLGMCIVWSMDLMIIATRSRECMCANIYKIYVRVVSKEYEST